MKWYEIAVFIVVVIPVGTYLNEVVRHRRSMGEDITNLWQWIKQRRGKRERNNNGGKYEY